VAEVELETEAEPLEAEEEVVVEVAEVNARLGIGAEV
jgi:hypothetical protein